MKGAFDTEQYRNCFLELGYDQEQTNQKVMDTFYTMFYGPEEERLYHPVGSNMGYIEDTGNHDVRTEGMSYGMMMCVQMNRKEEFDCLWTWTKNYMYMKEGENAGYFAWSCQTNGIKNAYGPAPDGEEYFAMALFFAANRWGNGEGIYNYQQEARQILKDCIHKGELPGTGKPMWNPENKLITFVPECDFTDPSYHLPHFYELFALWADEEDRSFWKEAADASREYLKKACDPNTGMCAEYAEYDGTPHDEDWGDGVCHSWYYSDSYRTIANIALDYSWFAADDWECENTDLLQKFFSEEGSGELNGVYRIDGTRCLGIEALHPLGMLATIGQASLVSSNEYSKKYLQSVWDASLRKGPRRYYDNCLYFFALLALSGLYRIWK